MQAVKAIKEISHIPNQVHDPKVYRQAVKLKRQGYGPKQISRILGVARGTVSSWLYSGKSPTNKLRFFNPVPSKELSYVVGAVLGDGCLFYNKGYQIQLVAKDREFVVYFGRCLTKLLKRKRMYPLFKRDGNKGWSKMYGMWATSKLLWLWLQNWELHKTVVKSHPDSFLRGLYDSEGSICKRGGKECLEVVLVNTRRELLEFAEGLLKKLGIDSYIYIINDRRKNRRTCYRLSITGKDNLLLFYDKVGFTIRRKQQRLENLVRTIRELRAYGIDDRRVRWRPSRKRLRELYWEKGLSLEEIAGKYRVSPPTVCNRMKMFDLPRRDSKNFRGVQNLG